MPHSASSKPGESTWIGIVHHSVGDGYSLALLFHDLSIVVGQPLPALSTPKLMDELLHLTPSSSTQPTKEDTLEFKPICLAQTALATLSIEYLRVSTELTVRLVAVSRQYATTVNTLLNAALLVAGAKRTASRSERPVVLRSPASIREAVRVGSDFGLYIVTKPLAVTLTPTTTVLDLVHVIQQGLADTKSVSYIKAYVQRFRDLLIKPVELNTLVNMMSGAPSIDLMLTNLGRASLPSNWGSFPITSFWDPLVLAGDGTEQTVGAITFNEQLDLTQASLQPLIKDYCKWSFKFQITVDSYDYPRCHYSTQPVHGAGNHRPSAGAAIVARCYHLRPH